MTFIVCVQVKDEDYNLGITKMNRVVSSWTKSVYKTYQKVTQ